MEATTKQGKIFSGYEVFVIAVLTFLQFTVILDFMVLSPLGDVLMKELKLSPAQFGNVVAGYAISAGISGILAAGFADRFDRKKFLLFFYTGFVAGTFLCARAGSYESLLTARIITGLFGGVIGSIGFTIITDLFPFEKRGRVMGFVQMGFASAQALGIPIGLSIADKWGWQSPFLMVVGLSLLAGTAIVTWLRPVTKHLAIQSDHSPFEHFIRTASNRTYTRAFAATLLLATGGFMMMPFGTAFAVNNLGLLQTDMKWLFGITGIAAMFFGPLIGKLADRFGKFRMFVFGTVLSAIMVVIYTHQGITPFTVVAILNVILFAGILSRMISSSSLTSAIPSAKDRGAFMGITGSVQYISGGIAAMIAGRIIVKAPDQTLQNYDVLGFVVLGTMSFTVIMMYYINKIVTERMAEAKTAPVAQAEPVH